MQDALLKNSMTTAAHLGTVNRFVNKMLDAKTLTDVSDFIKAALLEFGLSGNYIVRNESGFVLFSFGQRLPGDLLDELCSVKFGASRIAIAEESMHIRFRNLVLSVSTIGVDADKEVLQDTLAIFCETASRGIRLVNSINALKQDEALRRQQVRSRLEASRTELANLTQSLVSGEKELTEFLLLNIVSMFPVIGLEADQEERVLSVISQASDRLRVQSTAYIKGVDEIDESMYAAVSHLKQTTS
jgi:hypothetical protein